MITEKLDGQILTNANDQIAHIAHQTDELSQRIQANETELATIGDTQDKRLNEIWVARADHATKQETHDQAVHYAKLAHDTPNESVAVKAVSSAKKELNAACKHLEQLEASDKEARQAEQVRRDELLDAANGYRAEQKCLAQEQQSLEAIRSKASRQIALQKHTAILQGYAEHEGRVDAIRRQLVEAQVAKHDFHQDALEQLSGHSDLQRAVEERRPLDDATTRLFEMTLLYLDTFMANTRDVSKDAKLPSLLNIGNGSYGDVLRQIVIHEGELFDFLRRAPGVNPPATLPATREKLAGLLEEYRTWAREQERVEA